MLILLTGLFFLQPSNLWKTINVNSADYTLLLYALSSLNFIAFVIFAFIFSRSLLKLRQERRALQIGSKIKTRLLIYFFAISILPLIAMSVFSYLFMNRALDRWFTQIPEEVIRKSESLADENAKEQNQLYSSMAGVMLGSLERVGNNSEVVEIAKETGISAVYIESGNVISRIYSNDSKPDTLAQFDTIARNRSRGDPSAFGDRKLATAAATDESGRTLITIYDISPIVAQKAYLDGSLAQLDELKSGSNSVRNLGLVTLGFLTFLLMFATSWMAFYVAKGLTRPIRALAEGSEQLTEGNFGYQVDTYAEDELDMLVTAFNEMSTTLKENAEELEARRKYIETILQSLSTGVISLDDDNRVTTINKAARLMFRLPDIDFVGIEIENVVSEEDASMLSRIISRAKRIGQASEQRALMRASDLSDNQESEISVALSATALADSSGVVLVIEDLSETIAAQRALAWREVARRMAHEIKNPLTPIQLSAERIAKRFSDGNGGLNGGGLANRNSSIVKEGTDTIIREVSSLKSMVNEFSQYARLPHPKLAKGDLNDVILQTISLYDDRLEGVEVDVALGRELPEIAFDFEQIKRVFVNLIDNSAESFESEQEEKTISISTRFDSARELIIAEVSDNGIGIEPKDFQKLFQPYFSTKKRGTGLGLAIVQQIISDHNGRIRSERIKPRGAKFVIELPASS